MTDKEYAVRPNKTQLKREIRALNDLGRELIKMPDSALAKVPLSESMVGALREGKRLSKGALQRQLRLIASLMRNEDVEAIRMELERHKQPSRQQTQELHQLEGWRDQLIQGDDKLLTELIDEYPEIDRQYMRQLVRNAQHEAGKNKPPKSSRLLFQYLSKIKRDASPATTDDGEIEFNSVKAQQT